MTWSANQLWDELKVLRKGRGIYALNIGDQVGPALRACTGVGGTETPEVVRTKVADWLARLARALPADLRLAVLAGMAVHPDAQQLFLSQRVQWLAERLDRDERTARRRMDEGLRRIAEAAVGQAQPASGDERPPRDAWYVEELRSVLRLDAPSPEALELRRIVAEQPGLDRLEAMLTLPREYVDTPGPHELGLEVVYGARIVARERVTASTFRCTLRLPVALRPGERHEYALLYRVPPGQPMRSQYLIASPRRCDAFDLRVRFDPARVPAAVWRVSGELYAALDEHPPAGEEVAVDRCAEVRERFRDLRPGFCYGLSWKP